MYGYYIEFIRKKTKNIITKNGLQDYTLCFELKKKSLILYIQYVYNITLYC